MAHVDPAARNARTLAVMGCVAGLGGLAVIALLHFTVDPGEMDLVTRRFYSFGTVVFAIAYATAAGSALLARRNPRLQATLIRITGMVAFFMCWLAAGTGAGALHFAPSALLMATVVTIRRGESDPFI